MRRTNYELVVLDEFTYLASILAGYDTGEAISVAQAHKPARLNLLITGRNAPAQALIDYADTVTEMVKVKHAFDAGVKARAGIEF